MKRVIQKYRLHWILAILLIIALLFVDFGDHIERRDTDDEITFQPKQDSSRSTSPHLQLYDPDLSESDSDKEEPNEDPSIDLNFSDPFSLLHPDIETVLAEAAGDSEEDKERTTNKSSEDSPAEDPNITPSADRPTFTKVDLAEINQFVNSTIDDRAASSPSAQVSIAQAASNDGNRAIIIGPEPDYNQVGTDNEYVQVKRNSRMNNQLITQIGRHNYAEQLILNTIFSDLIIRSIGNDNTAVQNVINGYNTIATITQNGSFNEAYQEIYSRNINGSLVNTVNEVRQIGFSNWFRSFQAGRGNEIDVVQNGSLNQVQIDQNGDNNSATVRQSGSGNSVVIKQN